MATKKQYQEVPCEAPDLEEPPKLDQEQIELSFRYYFNWGYPDYLYLALKTLLKLNSSPEELSELENAEFTWAQLREMMDEAESYQVKYLVACNPNTPASVLDYLSEQSLASMLERIAENPRTHPKTLSRLAQHAEAAVRVAVVDNLNTSLDTLAMLAVDENPDVRYRLAESFSIPQEILEKLAEDGNPYVSFRARQTLNRLTTGKVVSGRFASHISEKHKQTRIQ